jgi:hypothetical protein
MGPPVPAAQASFKNALSGGAEIMSPRLVAYARLKQVPHDEMHHEISKQSRIENAGVQKGDQRRHSALAHKRCTIRFQMFIISLLYLYIYLYFFVARQKMRRTNYLIHSQSYIDDKANISASKLFRPTSGGFKRDETPMECSIRELCGESDSMHAQFILVLREYITIMPSDRGSENFTFLVHSFLLTAPPTGGTLARQGRR